MVSPELKNVLNAESLQRWENTGNLAAPYAGPQLTQQTRDLDLNLNNFVLHFKKTSWMNDAEACRVLNRDITQLNEIIENRKASIQGMDNLEFFKRDLNFCQISKGRAEEVKTIVDHFKGIHATAELRALSGGLAKLIEKFDNEAVQDAALMKGSLTAKLQDAIQHAYSHSTKKSPKYLEESLGMTWGKRSSDNRALAAALKPSHQNLKDNAFFHQTLGAVQLMEKGFTQRGDAVPPVLAGKLSGVVRELFEMFPKQTHVWMLRKTINDAYNHYSNNYHSKILEQSLGRHFGANSPENRELREILHHPDLENVSDEKLMEMTQRADALIRKGFQQMDNERIPPELAQQLKDLSQFNR